MLLDVVLNLLLERVGALGAGGQHDAGLDHLAAHLVRGCGHAALQHVGQLHDDGFDLERPDAVAGGLDHVVHAADVGQEAVLILPGDVAGVVPAVVQHLVGLFLIAVVAHEQAAGRAFADADADLAVLAGGDGVAVGIQQADVVQGRGTAHAAHLVGIANQVGNR